MRTRALLVPLLVPLLLLAAVVAVSGCAAATDETDVSVPVEPTAAYLELEINPRVGEAPLEVDMIARLVGQPPDEALLNCPSLAWDFGNDDVLIAQATNCKPGWVQRVFEARYTYQHAGSYDASVRVLAADVDPSSSVQVLVRGPTPTAQPMAIVPGPTIIIATAIPRAGTAVPEAPTVTLAPATLVAIAPVEVTEVAVRPAAEATVRPAAEATVRQAAEATVRPVAEATVRQAAEATTRAAATATRAVATSTLPPIRRAATATRPTFGPASTDTAPTLRATRRPPAVAMATEFAIRELSATPTRVSSPTPSGMPTAQASSTPSATLSRTPSRTTSATARVTTATPRVPTTAIASATSRPSPTRTAAPTSTVRPTRAVAATDAARPTRAVVATDTARPTRTSTAAPTASPTNTVPSEATRSSVTLAPEPTARPAASDGAARVLPADLYYVTSRDGQLWRLPATGLAPTPLSGLDLPVDAYSVSPTGAVAYTSDGALRLSAPGSGGTRTVAGAGASTPLWSPGGRTLAYSADGVWLYDVASGQQTMAADEGEPLAWSHDGDHLLMRDSDGSPIVAQLGGGRVMKLPIDPVGEAGWLPGRPVAWMVGPGLRMLTTGDSTMLSTILEGSVPTSGGFARPDDTFQLLADRGAGFQRHVVDLTDPRLAVVADGPPLTIPAGSEFSWAPDGRLGALAGRSGLKLLDPLTGAQAPLVGDLIRDPQWALSVD